MLDTRFASIQYHGEDLQLRGFALRWESPRCSLALQLWPRSLEDWWSSVLANVTLARGWAQRCVVSGVNYIAEPLLLPTAGARTVNKVYMVLLSSFTRCKMGQETNSPAMFRASRRCDLISDQKHPTLLDH